MPFPIIAVIGLCKVCALVGGAVFCVHKASKAYNKHQKNKKDKLELKGKTIEQAQEENKKLDKENDDWKKKYDELDDRMKKRDKEAKEITEKLKDPKLTTKERGELEEKLALLISQQDNDKKEKDNILDKIKKIGERIKNNKQVISGSISNLDDKHWIWDVLTLENILIGVGIYVVYKMLKDKENK